MERRLMKDFQIGMVEGIINEVIQSEKGPKDVFSKIAQAIGRRSSSKKGKKDWNAMVRQSTMSRDPIGNSADAHARQSRQSLRRHIIESQGSAMATMDPERLVEYNPKLSTVSPATRVAYAKFKIAKIKQEFDLREAAEGTENTSQKGDDDVFQDGPASVKEVNETKQDSSIVRPRPRPSIPSLSSLKSASGISLDSSKAQNQPAPSSAGAPPSIEVPGKKEFRPKTPIPEDPREDMTTPEPSTPKSAVSTPKPATPTPGPSPAPTPSPRPPSRTSTNSKVEEKDEVKTEDKKEKAEVKKEAPKPSTSSNEPKRPAGPPKLGGKSKVTGEVLQGWL